MAIFDKKAKKKAEGKYNKFSLLNAPLVYNPFKMLLGIFVNFLETNILKQQACSYKSLCTYWLHIPLLSGMIKNQVFLRYAHPLFLSPLKLCVYNKSMQFYRLREL